MLPVQSDCIDTHEDAEDRTKRLYWIGDVEAPHHGAVQFARLQARLAEKDQLLYEMLSCAHEMLTLDDSQKEDELRYMEALLTDHYRGRLQVPVPAEPEEEYVVARRVTAVSVMTKGRRGVCELASGREAVSS